jgi:hypothetical protein
MNVLLVIAGWYLFLGIIYVTAKVAATAPRRPWYSKGRP